MLDRITQAAAARHLIPLGVVRPTADDPVPDGTRSILLLGPSGAGFWNYFQTQPEYADARPDPVDRWSTRVIAALADTFGATPVFPFGQSPPAPFISWALRSGQAWASPVGLLVHVQAGVWVSYRGALALPVDLHPTEAKNPCESCTARPCETACPADALTPHGYDIPACHAFLDTPAGTTCLSAGCAVRAACPVSHAFARDPAQSAHHMKAFHP